MKKIVVVFLVFVVLLFVGVIVFDRFIYPISVLLPGSKPWSEYEGKSCNFGGCDDSEINKIYNYYSDSAVQESDPSLCEKVRGIDNGDYTTSREEAVYFCKASYGGTIGDFEYCNALDADIKYPGTRSQKDACLSTLIEKHVQDIEFCDKFPKDSLYASRDNCYSEVAYKKGDFGPCFLIERVVGSTEFWRKSCVIRVGTKIGDASACARLKLAVDRQDCENRINSRKNLRQEPPRLNI